MIRVPAFWDSSAMAPLCVHENATRSARAQFRRFTPVVWWGTVVEVHSAISRLHREARLDDLGRTGALARLDALSQSWREILPSDSLRELAANLLDKYELRAADSFQLASALIWCQQRPSKRNFVCSDERLSKAAEAAGFSVVPLLRTVP